MGLSDLDYPTALLVAVLFVTTLTFAVGLSTSGNALGPYNYEWDGGSTLRTDLAAASDETVLARAPADYRSADPNSTIAVVPAVERVRGGTGVAAIQGYLARGGTVVVAGEGDDQANALLSTLGAETRIDGDRLLDERHNDGSSELPHARNVSEHPLVADVDRLALNNATALSLPGPDRPGAVGSAGNEDVTVLVRSSPFGYLDRNGNGSFDESEQLGEYPVVAVESVGAGRVVVVSDTSVFTNAMLEEAENRAFVRAVGESSETTLIDYTHGPGLAPLTYALLTLRAVPLLQAAVGLASVVAVALWAVGTGATVPSRVRGLLGRDGPPAVDVALDDEELAAFLRDRYPDWDRERVARVSETIIRQRHEGDVDD